MANVNDLVAKAQSAFIDDNFKLAVDYYTQAINLGPQTADLHVARAQTYIKLNNFTEALADCNRAIELDSSTAKAYLYKGIAYIKLGKYDIARETLDTGASLTQNDVKFTELIKQCDEHVVDDGESRVKKKDKESEKPKYRHDFYQKPEEVVVGIFAKGIHAENMAIDFGEQILSVTINVPGETSYHFQPRLFGKIVPEKCSYEVLKTKLEIRLAKADAIHWKSLEYTTDGGVVQCVNKPSYPSSKRRVSDWDKLEAQLKMEEKQEKVDGDAALQKMFGEIYSNADENMRRAMNKSFIESNGTVLSTSWDEVGSKKIDPVAPDGMELRKFEY